MIRRWKHAKLIPRRISDFSGIKVSEIINNVAPWELETFLLFSLKSYEYSNKDFKGKNINQFVNIINCIKNYEHPVITKLKGDPSISDLIMMALGLIQFDLQEYNIYKYYRYNWFFNYKTAKFDLQKVFFEKFNCIYYEFVCLGFLLNILYSTDKKISSDVINFIIKKYEQPFFNLLASRKYLVEQIDKFINGTEDYLYCVRPFYIYPFIEEKGYIYLPLPHCLMRATTASLLYKLTDNNNTLRESIGKNVIEDYLYQIISESNLFDEVVSEQEYTIGKNKKRTLDIMCRVKSKYLFLDSKSLSPYSKLRQLDFEFMNKEIEKVAKYIIQVYKHLHARFNVEYDFFNHKEQNISKDNIWGLVVILEDSYIRRQLIYEKVSELLSMNKNDEKYKWLINHIKVVSLYDIERYVFVEESIINKLEKQLEKNRPFDYSLIEDLKSNKLKNHQVIEFKKQLKDKISEITKELLDAGIILKST